MTCPRAQPAVSTRHAAEMRGCGEDEGEKDALGSSCAASGPVTGAVTGAGTAAVRVECSTRSSRCGGAAVTWVLAVCLLLTHAGTGDALISSRSDDTLPAAAAAAAAAAHTPTVAAEANMLLSFPSLSLSTSSSFHAPSSESAHVLPSRRNNPSAPSQPSHSPLPPPPSPPASISTATPTLPTSKTPNPTISFRLPLSRKTLHLPDIVPEQSSNQGTLTNQIQFNTQIAEAKAGGTVDQNNSQSQTAGPASSSKSPPAPPPCSDKKCEKERAKEEIASDASQLHRDVGQVGQDVRDIGQDVAQFVTRTPLDLTYTFPTAPDYRRTFTEIIPEGADGIFVSFPGSPLQP